MCIHIYIYIYIYIVRPPCAAPLFRASDKGDAWV